MSRAPLGWLKGELLSNTPTPLCASPLWHPCDTPLENLFSTRVCHSASSTPPGDMKARGPVSLTAGPVGPECTPRHMAGTQEIAPGQGQPYSQSQTAGKSRGHRRTRLRPHPGTLLHILPLLVLACAAQGHQVRLQTVRWAPRPLDPLITDTAITQWPLSTERTPQQPWPDRAHRNPSQPAPTAQGLDGARATTEHSRCLHLSCPQAGSELPPTWPLGSGQGRLTDPAL